MDEKKQRLVHNLVTHMSQARRVAEGLGIALSEIPAPPQAAEVAVGV
jgi:hypothetical protein